MFLQWAIVVLLIASIVFSFSIIKARNKWKRLLSYSLVTAKILMIIVLYALHTGTTFFLDFAIVYALLGYIGIIVLANYMLEWRKPKQ